MKLGLKIIETMDGIIEHEMAERDGGGCGCARASLGVLQDVQRAYEHRMELLNRSSGNNKLEKQVKLLQSWVSDLVGQNALLARTVEELEEEVMARLLLERRRHAEADKSNAYDTFTETKGFNEALQNEILAKEREIRRLNKETQQYEQTIMSLRKEVSLSKYHTPEVTKLDAEVTADICCPGMQIGEVTPVKDYSYLSRKETAQYQERLTEMEDSVKSSAERVRALREANIALNKEISNLRQMCFALGEQCQGFVVRSRFLEEVVREMRRQLRQAKTKMITSTPNTSREMRQVDYESDVSIIEHTPSPPIVISDDSDDLRMIGSSLSHKQEPSHQIDNKDKRTADIELEAKPSCQNQACSPTQNDSIGASSIAESVGSDARSRCLETKLMATLEVLKNKEETVRVQAESLALAEARIAALSARSPPPPPPPPPLAGPHALHADPLPLHTTRSSADGCCVESSDATEQTPEVDSKMVNTLRDNLSVIEELYRECFYETAKQEELIEMLRQSYLDMRQMDKQKTARITRLQGVVDTQQWSLERCKDIALEVDNLKSEISNFLSNSNHDSGMWERGEESAAELADELRHVAGQLLRLRALLTENCTCGLEDENTRLKRINETLTTQLAEFQQRVSDLEAALEDKENIDQNYQKQIDLKDLELNSLKQQLAELEKDSREQKNTNNALNLQIQQLQVLLQDRSDELTRTQKHCEDHVTTITQLRTELSKTENLSKEKSEVRSEVSALCGQVREWREQLRDARRRLRALADQLQRSRDHCDHLHLLAKEKEAECSQLAAQLRESRARGAALCGDARRALAAVRAWLRRQRALTREQEQKIKEQDKIIRNLQRHRLQPDIEPTSSEPCCSKYIPMPAQQSQRNQTRGSETASCSKCSTNGVRTHETHTSQSELSSNQSAPTPPRRLRKKSLCKERHCQWPSCCEVSSQQPLRSDVETGLSHDSLPPTFDARHTREMSPTDEILERVEQTHEAFVEAHRRWRRKTSFEHVHRGT